MKVAYWIYDDQALIYSKFYGPITFSGFEHFRATLAADPQHNPTYSHLLDFRLGDLAAVTTAEIQTVAQTAIHTADGRRAIVTATLLNFGIAKMADAWFQDKRPLARTFNDLDAALNWLEIDAGFDLMSGKPTDVKHDG